MVWTQHGIKRLLNIYWPLPEVEVFRGIFERKKYFLMAVDEVNVTLQNIYKAYKYSIRFATTNFEPESKAVKGMNKH